MVCLRERTGLGTGFGVVGSLMLLFDLIIVLINVDSYGLSTLCSEKGGTNMLRTLFLLEKYETNIDDVGGKRRWNILQWSKNNFKSKINTNGDYFKSPFCILFF